MAAFDANIKLLVEAKQAFAVIKKLESRLKNIEVTKTGAQTAKQVEKLIAKEEQAVKLAQRRLETEISLASAKELYARRAKQLERAGGATNKDLKDQINAIQRLVKLAGDNVGVMSRAATLTGRVLERQRELNRENLRSNTILNRTAQYTERINKLRGVRKVQDLVDLNKQLKSEAKKRLTVAAETERKLKEQLRLKERSVKAEQRSVANAKRQREEAARSSRQTRTAALNMRRLAKSFDTVINKFERLNRAQRAASQLALPSTEMLKPQQRGFKILDLSDRTRELRIQQRLERNAERNKQIEKEMLELNKARKKALEDIAAQKRKEGRATVRLAQREQQLNNATSARVKPLSSPVRGGAGFPGSPKFLEQQSRNRRKRFTDLATGVGFPLLFGGGPGATIGGLVGGAAGGFGGSIIASAIGAQFDKLGEAAKRLADNLNDPVALLDELSNSGFIVSDSLKEHVKALEEQGLAADAAQLAITAFTEKIGSAGVQSIKRFDEASDKLRDRLATLALIVFSELAPAIEIFIKGITNIVDRLLGPEVQRQAANLDPVAFQRAQVDAAAESSASLLGGSPRNYESILNAKSAQIVASASLPVGVSDAAVEAQRAQVEINNKQIGILNKRLQLEQQSNTNNISIKRTLQEQIITEEFAIKKLQAKGDKQKLNALRIEEQIELQKIFNQFVQDQTRFLEQQEEARRRAARIQDANLTRFNIDKQRLIIAQNQNNLLDEQVFNAREQIINEDFLADKRKEAAGELKKGNADLIRSISLQDLRNNRAREANALLEKNTRLKEKADKDFEKAKNLTAELKNQVALQAVSGSVEEKKLRATIAYDKLVNQINGLEDQSFSTEQKRLATRILNTDLVKIDFENQQRIEQILRDTVRPLKDIREQHEAGLNANKEYNRLLMEGVLPAEAQRIVNFNRQVEAQMRQIEEATTLTEIYILQAKALNQSTTALESQLELLKLRKKAIEGEAAKGPGGGEKTDGQIIEDRVAELKGELTEMTKLGNVVVQVADNIGSAFSTAFQDVINGSKSTQEALSDMLKTVGESFVKMAAEIITKQLMMIALQSILKALGGPSFQGGGETAFGGGGKAISGPSGATEGITLPRANGGPARAGQPYMVGERGPELFVPSNNGGVMRNEDMRQLMGRSPAASNAPSMNFTFETTNIGGQEFVSREQLEAAMATTRRQAANDGAKRGMSMTLDKMQNSPRTRSRIGIS